MLKKPSPKNRNSTLGKATLRSPRVGFHHAHLLKRSLLSQCLVNDFEPRRFTPCCARCNRVFLSHGFSCYLNLTQNTVLQTLEMSRHGFQRQRRVHRGCTITRHRFERRHHALHLIAVVLVPSVDLEAKPKAKYKYATL